MTASRQNADPMSLIGVFIDGTMNEAEPTETRGRTNARLLFEEFRSRRDAVCLYLPGVGGDAVAELDAFSTADSGLAGAIKALLSDGWLPAKGLFGNAFGAGLTARVLAAYAFVCAARKQHPQARICILGFSRGAYACCVLAHFMNLAGLVVADGMGLHLSAVRNAWTYDEDKLARMIERGELNAWQLPAEAGEAVQVDFLGCWDTVCAMGAPEHGLNVDVGPRWLTRALDGLAVAVHRQVKAWNPRFVQLFVPPNVVKARHALALHEYRVAFEPMLWLPPQATARTDMRQMWFPGAHADVGGGYAEAEASRMLSGHALHWMRKEVWPERSLGSLPLTKRWPVHDSGLGKFRAFGPRLRRSLAAATDEQLRTMAFSEWLAFGLELGPEFRSCDGGEPATAGVLPELFRPEIAALHIRAHRIARLMWLRSRLIRAASKHPAGQIPAAFAHPTATEAFTALCDQGRFFRKLDASGLAKLGLDPARIVRVARLCCYHLALTDNPSHLLDAAQQAVREARDPQAREIVLTVVTDVILAPIAFLFDERTSASCNLLLRIDAMLDHIDRPSSEGQARI